MNLEQTYQTIIQGLKNGGRGSIKLSKQDVSELQSELRKFSELTSDKINQILCVLSHDQGFHKELVPELLKLIQEAKESETLVFALSTFSRHGIAARLRDGERMDGETLKMLETLLLHSSGEVVEWVLRTIDEMGSQGRYFLPVLQKIKPGTMAALVNKHKKNSKEIIEMLEKRWRIVAKN